MIISHDSWHVGAQRLLLQLGHQARSLGAALVAWCKRPPERGGIYQLMVRSDHDD